MALDSNVMIDICGKPLPHFTPHPTPNSLGVNLFAQDLSLFGPLMRLPYVFPPLILVGPLLCLLRQFQQSCTMVILDLYPRRYWWPILQRVSVKKCKLACKGAADALSLPATNGWIPYVNIPGDLWVFSIKFS